MKLRCLIPILLATIGQGQSLTLRVTNEPAPAGGWTQIRVYADAPILISKGTLAIDLDPLRFGPIEGVSAFSAAGDVAGLASVSGNHVEASFVSPSGSIGQLPGVPIFIVRAPILANPTGPGYVALSLPPLPKIRSDPYPANAWVNASGQALTTTLLSGNISVGGSASIRNVWPQGFQAAGTVLHVDGTGFTPTTKIQADGASFTSAFVSATRIDLTLTSSAELTGVRFYFFEPGSGRTIEFFSALPSTVTPLNAVSTFPVNHVIMPIVEGKATSNTGITTAARTQSVLYNPTASPIEIRVTETVFGTTRGSQFLLEPGVPTSYPVPGSLAQQLIESDVPFRAVTYFGQLIVGAGARAAFTTPAPAISFVGNAASQRSGPIAPREFVTLRGTGLDNVSSVTFNGVAATVLYRSAEQWNVTVPDEVEGSNTAMLRLATGGDARAWTVAVNPAAPGIFTLDASGAGRGAVLNQDNTVNSPEKFADLGTAIQIFATGGGTNRLPVKAFFSDTEATVVFAGPAPGLASGALQVNAIVPRIGRLGEVKPVVPLTLEIDGVRSPPVNIAIR